VPDIYERLAQFYDRLPAGFPPAPDRADLKILRRLFTPEEAGLVLHMTLLNEEAAVIALRAHRPVDDVAGILADLAQRGLIISTLRPGRTPLYSASQFVIGFYEGQVNHWDRELAELVEAYLPTFAQKGSWTNGLPQMRTIPVGESIPVRTEVLPYECAEEIVRKNSDIAVIPCVCRQEKAVLGRRCDKPMETCMSFGGMAAQVIASGLGRRLSQEEALGLLKAADDHGLVLQPANSQDPIFLCACCSCCCGVLTMLKSQPRPAELVSNPFQARHDPAACIECGACEPRCPLGALSFRDGQTTHDPDRCIGCGLCVSVCPTGALSMVRKLGGQQPSIPRTTLETYLRLGQLRDPLFAVKMAGLMVRSKIEHLIAPR
jgi:ferredoxin